MVAAHSNIGRKKMIPPKTHRIANKPPQHFYRDDLSDPDGLIDINELALLSGLILKKLHSLRIGKAMVKKIRNPGEGMVVTLRYFPPLDRLIETCDHVVTDPAGRFTHYFIEVTPNAAIHWRKNH